MKSVYAPQLKILLELIEGSGKLAHELFQGDTFEVFTKSDGSRVTTIDLAVEEFFVNGARGHKLRVRSEEGGGDATYGENCVIDLDSMDSTSDMIEGCKRNPRRAQAAPSAGFWDNEPVAGAVTFPLLGVEPITYFAAKGGRAFRLQNGRETPLRIDTTPTRGIVFVTSKQHTSAAQATNRVLRNLGYTPVPEHGAVFKTCAMVDPGLLRQYPYHKAQGMKVPVVGYLSRGGVHLYDVAGVTPIVREAGGIVTPPQNVEGKQPWVAAVNPEVYDDLWKLALAG